MNSDKASTIAKEYIARRAEMDDVLVTVKTQLGVAAHDGIRTYLETMELIETMLMTLAGTGIPKILVSPLIDRCAQIDDYLAKMVLVAAMYDKKNIEADQLRMEEVGKFLHTLKNRATDNRIRVIDAAMGRSS